jgi:hypothetical protein
MIVSLTSQMIPSARNVRCARPMVGSGIKGAGLSSALWTAAAYEIGRIEGNSLAASVVVQTDSLRRPSISGRDMAGGTGVTKSSQ